MSMRTACRAALRTTAAAVLLAAAPVAASAQLINFTHGGFAKSGSIGGVSFVDKLFTISARGNVLNRELELGAYSIAHDVATIDIQDVGLYTFLTGTRTFVSPTISRAGFSRLGFGGDLFSHIGGDDSPLSTWNMTSSIGPLLGTSQLQQWGGAFSSVLTDGGALFFGSDDDVSSTFSASTRFTPGTDPDPVPVPEPSSFALLAAAGALLLVRWTSGGRANVA